MSGMLRLKLQERKPLIGTFLTIPSPETAEILAGAGFDWLFIDMEHTTIDVKDVQRILQAVQNQCPCIIRVPSKEEVWMKRVLDTGAEGIIVPHINSVQEATQIIQFCKYPPAGSRSIGISRAQGYGMHFNPYMDNANENIMIIPQIEHIDGVRNIEPIVKVPGIDAVFIGPYDLSGSMGKAGKIKDPDVQKAIENVKTECVKNNLPIGIFCTNAQTAKQFIDLGYMLIAMGMDSLLLASAVKQALRELHQKFPSSKTSE